MNMRLLAMALIGCTLFLGVSFAKDVDKGNDVKPTLKQRYLKALTSPPNYDDSNFIDSNLIIQPHHSFSEVTDLSSIISSLWSENLHRDIEIQRALIAVRDHHPISDTRVRASSAFNALSHEKPYVIAIAGKSDDPVSRINKNRNYCTAESVGAKSLATVSGALIDELTPIYDSGIEGQDFNDEKVQNVDIFAKEVSGGWLTGYGKVPSLGLHYVPRDKSLETKFLLAGTIHAIIGKDNSDSVLVLSNDNRRAWGVSSGLCPSFLKVSEVKETAEGEFETRVLRTLPSRVQKVSQMENGDLFIAFGTVCYTRGIEGPVQDQYFFNPPIGLTASGHIYNVCEMGSTSKRW